MQEQIHPLVLFSLTKLAAINKYIKNLKPNLNRKLLRVTQPTCEFLSMYLVLVTLCICKHTGHTIDIHEY